MHALLLLLLAGAVVAQAPRNARRDRVPAPEAVGVWDPMRQRVVAFEPRDGDVWEWDGQAWARRFAVEAPDYHVARALYDPIRNRILAFGQSTQSWDGARWTPAWPNVPGWWEVAFDSARDRVVAFTGSSVREWDGTTWLTPAAQAPVVVTPSLVYDPVNQRTIVYGGGNGPGECWSWDGTSWSQLSATPGPRFYPGLMWDPAQQRVVLYGGNPNTSSTWALNGTTWTQLPTTNDPGPRMYARLVWDGIGALAWGGYAQKGSVWRLTANDWQRVADAPPRLEGAGLAIDEASQLVVLFAGKDTVYGSAPLQQTWTWDGDWHRQAPTTSPYPRYSALMTWSPVNNAVLLFGGAGPLGPIGDTWIWNGTNWASVFTPVEPPPRHSGAFSPEPGGTVMLFGGTNVVDQWRWDGQVWSQLTPTVMPNLTGATAGYDPVHGVTRMLGRNRGNNWPEAWDWDGTAWTPLPLPAGVYAFPYPPIVTFRHETGRMLFDTGFQTLEWDGVQWHGPHAIQTSGPRIGAGLATQISVVSVALGGSAPQRITVLTDHPTEAEIYGQGCARQTIPALTLRGGFGPEYGPAELFVSSWVPQTAAFCAFGLAPQQLPLGSGCDLLVGNPIGTLFAMTDAAGDAKFAVTVPAQPVFLGVQLHAQAAVHDPANSWFGGPTLTAGLRVVAGR